MPTKSVAEDFIDHRLVQHFSPPDGKDDPPCQTTHCTNVAVEQHNAQQVEKGKKIKNAVGVDSQMFILDQNDPISYWHLYFKGKVGRKPCKFFAELSGERGPEKLRICVEVDKAVAASVMNCDHCFGGIWHPLGGFLGCKKDDDEEEDEEGEEEEGEEEEERRKKRRKEEENTPKH